MTKATDAALLAKIHAAYRAKLAEENARAEALRARHAEITARMEALMAQRATTIPVIADAVARAKVRHIAKIQLPLEGFAA